MLETDRLIIRQFTLDDAPFMVELMNEPNWFRYIGKHEVHSIELAQKSLKEKYLKAYQLFGFGLYLVALKATNEALGMCGFVKRDYLEQVDIGFAFLERHCSKGYAFESAKELLGYGEKTLLFHTILAVTTPENQRSIALLHKLQFHFQATIQTPSGDQLRLYQYKNS